MVTDAVDYKFLVDVFGEFLWTAAIFSAIVGATIVKSYKAGLLLTKMYDSYV